MPPRDSIQEYWAEIARDLRNTSIQNNNTNIIIQSYNYIPNNFNFFKVNNEEELFLGVELEIDYGGKSDDNAKKVIDILGKEQVYCKHDGSLQNGFEIVTHPCTYEYHKTMPYEMLFTELIKLSYKSHDVSTCGMHVHFNRNYFGKEKLYQDLNISKLLYLFEKFWEKIVLIARRDSNHYARRFYLNDDETIFDMYAKSKNSNKYGVINLQHKNTVEIRIFKGTLNYRTFMVTLEFVKTMAQIIKNIDIYDIQYITWDNILNQLSNELVSYITEREKIKEQNSRGQQSNNIINDTMFSACTAFDSLTSVQPIGWGDTATFSVNNTEPLCITVSPEEVFNREYLTSWTNLFVRANDSVRDLGFQPPPSLENMTIEQLKRKIKEIERMVRRSHNPMEQRSLRREIQTYSDKIAHLRGRR